MTQYFTAEVMDHEIAEILVKNPAYWFGLMEDEGYKFTAKEMIRLVGLMDGLERDEFLRQIESNIPTTRLTKADK